MNLKEYQIEALETLLIKVRDKIKNNEPDKITLSAPTGSGKTLIAIKFMDQIGEDYYIKAQGKELCFIWVSPGKGGLYKQSYYCINNIPPTNRNCFLIDDFSSLNQTELYKNQILVLNWEKVKSEDNIIMRSGEKCNFIDILKNTRDRQRKIILIIDESHLAADTEKADVVINHITPDITVKMTATPKEKVDIEIEIDKVIDEGMLKKSVLGNEFNYDWSEEESDRFIIKNAYHKRLEIYNEFQNIGVDINPLCIIQIPNYKASDRREVTRQDSIIKILIEDLKEKEENIGIYLQENKTPNTDYENNFNKLRKHNNNVNFLIFKQALDTGWDCNRTHMLLKLRDIKSEIFLKQIIGRIIRTPEQKHYSNDILDNAYVYADITDTNIKDGKYEFGPYKNLPCVRKFDPGLNLSTFYNTPTPGKSLRDKGGVEKHRIIFNDYFDKHLINECGLEKLDNDITRPLISIISNFSVHASLDEIDKSKSGEKIHPMSDYDIQYEIESELYKATEGFVPFNTIPVIKSLFRQYCKNNFDLDEADSYILFYKNMSYFLVLIKDFLNEKCNYERSADWKPHNWMGPPEEYKENGAYKRVEFTHYLYDPAAPCCDSKIEDNFNSYIEGVLCNDDNLIEWWFKNGRNNKDWFGIKYHDKNTYAFYPDYLIKFVSGYLGIFDTKSGWTESTRDVAPKSDALQQYIQNRVKEGIKIVGGIIRPKGQLTSYEINYTVPYNPDNNWVNFKPFIESLK